MKLNYSNIQEVYDKFVKPKQTTEYLNRYSKLPIHLNNKDWVWEDKDFPRVISLLEFEKFSSENDLSFNNVLSFNGINDPEYQFIKYNNIKNYNYLDNSDKYDLHTLDLETSDFDFFMCNQTLEHVYDPCLVLRNIHKHLKKGGLFYCNVPSFNMAHDTPHHHYIGFTPVGLGCVVQQAGFEIIDIGFWGNTDYINFMINNNDWPDYRKISNYSSEINKEVISWIFAKKI
jgi:SAM-dependent methyltransferase